MVKGLWGRRLSSGSVVWGWLVLIGSAGLSAAGGEPPRMVYLPMQEAQIAAQENPPPLPFAPVYKKRATWHETMRASVAATFPKAAVATGKRAAAFHPTMVRLSRDAAPVTLTFAVGEVERLYLAAVGRAPEDGSACFLNPRLWDRRGRCHELRLDGPVALDEDVSDQAEAVELDIDGQTLPGIAVPLGEIVFQLDRQYERLQVDVYYDPQIGLPPWAAVDCQPICQRAEENRQVFAALWERVAREFRDRQSQIEMEYELRDGLWNPYAPAGGGASGDYYLAQCRARLELAQRTLELVEPLVPLPALAAETAALAARVDGLTEGVDVEAARALFAQAVDLRRRIIFAHPALGFDRLLISKRPPPLLSAPGDNYYGINNGTGPGLVVLEGWQDDRPVERVLLEGQLPAGCAMHADVSFDGRRIVFAYADHRAPHDQRQFFLYEIGADGQGLRQITGTDHDRLQGAGGRMTVLCEDFDPCYLPDGGFAFISTRNQGGVRCHDGDRYCPTYLLFRCDGDGSNIRQLSFGEANEWDPTMMPDGQLLWVRWDYINRPVIPTLGLWTIRPDGTAAAHYFGNYTANPCRICEARPIPGSHKIVATTAGHHTMHAGSLIVIDHQVASDGLDAIVRLTPEATFPESEEHSPVSFASPYPLSEDLFLAAFSPDPCPGSMDFVPRANAYGIYLVDSLGGRELLYRDPKTSCFEPMPIVPRPQPPLMPTHLTADAASAATGVFYVQDVYASTQEIPRGTIHRLRVNELIPQPTQRVPYSSAVNYEVLKRVLGTVPVEEDGSVAFEAPAGVPLQFQALDENGLAVMTMRTFTHLQPGEQASCIGCHEPRNASPHPVPRTDVPLVRQLDPPAGPRYAGGLSFGKTVQPVLDRYCLDCHGLDETADDVNLVGTFTATPEDVASAYHRLLPSTSYAALLEREGLVSIAQYGAETWYSAPHEYFAHGGRLAGLLQEGHAGVQLDADSFQRIVDWLDLNAPLYGTYSWNKEEWRQPDPAGEAALRDAVRRRFGAALADQPFAALVNVALPEESRILRAPLAVAAGGWGQIPPEAGGWRSSDDPSYRRMVKLVEAAIEPLPYHDIAGTCGRDEDCQCLSCWVRKLQEARRERLAATAP